MVCDNYALGAVACQRAKSRWMRATLSPEACCIAYPPKYFCMGNNFLVVFIVEFVYCQKMLVGVDKALPLDSYEPKVD